MITTFEAGAVFKIVNEASPVIREISRDVAKLDKGVTALRLNLEKIGAIKFGTVNAELKALNDTFVTMRPELSGVSRQLGLVDRRLGTLSATASTSRGTLAGTFSAMSAGTSAALADLRLLTAQWRALALSMHAAGGALRLPAARGGGGGRGGRDGGFHVGSIGAPLPGGMRARFHAGNDAAMVGAGALFYGAYLEAQIEHEAYNAAFSGQKIGGGLPSDSQIKQRMLQITKVVKDAASQSGFGQVELAKAATKEIQLLAPLPWAQRMQILPELLPIAGMEASLKHSDPNETMSAIIKVAHTQGIYDAVGIGKYANQLGGASIMADTSIVSLARAYGYVGGLRTLGYDPTEMLGMTVALQRGPGMNTKSGTWLNAMLTALLPGSNVFSKTAFKKHEWALEQLGLYKNGQPTFLDASGNPSAMKALEIAGAAYNALPVFNAANPQHTKGAVATALFGKQGERAFDYLASPAVLSQMEQVPNYVTNFSGAEEFYKSAGKNDPLLKFQKDWRDLGNVLSDIGKYALPPLVGGLQAFDEVLKVTAGYFPSTNAAPKDSFMTGLNKSLGRGMKEGGVVGAVAGGIGGALFGGVGALPGALTGGGIGALVGGTYEGGKYIWRYLTAPKTEISIQPGKAVLNIDGRQFAEAIIPFIAKAADGPAQGAPYHDSTYSTAPVDLVGP